VRAKHVFPLLALALAACRAEDAPPSDAGTDAPSGPWRSALYPADWTPSRVEADGRFLHDFSYAGYHASEVPLPVDFGGAVRSVMDDGADPSSALDSTAAIQKTIDAVGDAGGGVVLFPAGTYRVDGLLRVTSPRTLLRGEGPERSRLWFSRDVDMTDRASLTFAGAIAHGAHVPLAEDAAPRSKEVFVSDAEGLAPGDDVALGITITGAFVAEHGMTGTWKVSLGQWRPFFRRTVVAVDRSARPHRVVLDVPVRYPMKTRDGASLRKETGALYEVGLEKLGLSNAIGETAAWSFDRAHVLALEGVKDAFVRDVASFPSPLPGAGGAHLQSGGVLVRGSKRVTIDRVTFERAQNRGPNGNGYLFEISQGGEILVRDSVGRAGRHNFIQNWDFGTSGCVFLRCVSEDGRAFGSASPGSPSTVGASEYHHSLAIANLFDGCASNDGFAAKNRHGESSGAGHTATESVFWRTRGGAVYSLQYRWGYVIGTFGTQVFADPERDPFGGAGTLPADWVEGEGRGNTLEPASLFEDQLARRVR
jgi:hypothetical protein